MALGYNTRTRRQINRPCVFVEASIMTIWSEKMAVLKTFDEQRMPFSVVPSGY
jgi:hypothetical protein